MAFTEVALGRCRFGRVEEMLARFMSRWQERQVLVAAVESQAVAQQTGLDSALEVGREMMGREVEELDLCECYERHSDEKRNDRVS